MAYEMYFGNKLMPVTPSGVTMIIRNQNKTMVQINDGEINLLKRPGLTEVQFTLLLPNVPYPFARYQGGFQRADHYLTYLNELKVSRKPFKWILTRTIGNGNKVRLFDTNLPVSIEDYRIVEKAKNGFDVEVEITLKQYRDFATKTITITSPLPTAPIVVQEVRPLPPRSKPNPVAEQRKAGGGGSGRSRINTMSAETRARMAAKNASKRGKEKRPVSNVKLPINTMNANAKRKTEKKKAMKRR